MGLIIGALSAIAAAAVTVTKSLATIGLAVQAIKTIGNAIVSLGKALGLIKPGVDIEELGDRALQANEMGITPEQYGSFEAWVNKIEKDDWGYDPEKNKDLDPKEKIEKGVEVASSVLLEKYPDMSLDKFLTSFTRIPQFFTEKRMDEIGKVANEDEDAFEKIINYINGMDNTHETVDFATDLLIDIEQKIDPSISEDDAYDLVSTYKG